MRARVRAPKQTAAPLPRFAHSSSAETLTFEELSAGSICGGLYALPPQSPCERARMWVACLCQFAVYLLITGTAFPVPRQPLMQSASEK